MASGMALGGMKPFVCIYSTFLQRAYDQIIMDAAMNKAGVVFMLDRAGLTGPDGETHQGVFDLSYLRQIPGMVVCSPRNEGDLKRLLDLALAYDGPMAIRYSKECVKGGGGEALSIGEWEVIRAGNGIAILAAGRMMGIAVGTAALLKEKGVECTVVDARFIKPLDEKLLLKLTEEHSLIVTLEDNTLLGGFGSAVMEALAATNMDVLALGIPDEFLPQASVNEQLEMVGLTPAVIAGKIVERWKR